MEELQELLDRLREKLQYTRRLTEEYDHAMDFASHCTMQGLAEGIQFAIEEIEEMIRVPGPGSRARGGGSTKIKVARRGKGKGGTTGKGKDKSKTSLEVKAAKGTRTKEVAKGTRKSKEKIRIGTKRKKRR